MFDPDQEYEEYKFDNQIDRGFKQLYLSDVEESMNKKGTGRFLKFTFILKGKPGSDDRILSLWLNYEHEHKRCESESQLKLQQICHALNVGRFDPQKDYMIFMKGSRKLEADIEQGEDDDFCTFHSFRSIKPLTAVPKTNAASASAAQEFAEDDDIPF